MFLRFCSIGLLALTILSSDSASGGPFSRWRRARWVTVPPPLYVESGEPETVVPRTGQREVKPELKAGRQVVPTQNFRGTVQEFSRTGRGQPRGADTPDANRLPSEEIRIPVRGQRGEFGPNFRGSPDRADGSFRNASPSSRRLGERETNYRLPPWEVKNSTRNAPK